MKESKQPAGEEVVDESVSHYKAEKLADGRVRVSSGGHVCVAPTYYEALQNYAEWGQRRIEDAPDHLREDKRESIHHDTTNPEIADVVENDAEWLREEVVSDVLDGETTISRSGAWLAERRPENGSEDIGDPINVYRLWDTLWSGMQEENDD